MGSSKLRKIAAAIKPFKDQETLFDRFKTNVQSKSDVTLSLMYFASLAAIFIYLLISVIQHVDSPVVEYDIQITKTETPIHLEGQYLQFMVFVAEYSEDTRQYDYTTNVFDNVPSNKLEFGFNPLIQQYLEPGTNCADKKVMLEYILYLKKFGQNLSQNDISTVKPQCLQIKSGYKDLYQILDIRLLTVAPPGQAPTIQTSIESALQNKKSIQLVTVTLNTDYDKKGHHFRVEVVSSILSKGQNAVIHNIQFTPTNVELYDNPIFDEKISNTTVYNSKTTQGIQLGVPNYLAVITISIDTNTYTFKRSVYTFVKLLATIGGYATSVLAFYVIIRGFMSSDVDFARIYSHYLLFKKDPDSQDITGLELKKIDDSNLFDTICQAMKSPFACCSKKIKDKLREQKNEKLIKKFLTKNGLNEMSQFKDVDHIIRVVQNHEFMLEAMMGSENYQLAKTYRQPIIVEIQKKQTQSKEDQELKDLKAQDADQNDVKVQIKESDEEDEDLVQNIKNPMEVLQEFIKPEPEYDDLKETSLYPFEIQRYFKARMKQIMKKNMKNINPINID